MRVNVRGMRAILASQVFFLMEKFETNLCEGLCGSLLYFWSADSLRLFIYYLFVKISSGGQNALSIIFLEFLV